jgi:4-oxalocrotonate tautomerase family enzyme
MPLIQISTYLGRTREEKESFVKAMTNAVVEILKAKRQHAIMTYDQRLSENWYISGEQSSERRTGFWNPKDVHAA